MVRLVCVLLLLAVTASASSSRVVGGSPTSVEEYPSIVQVQRSLTGIWRQICAGTVLTSRYILSAASCFNGPDFIIQLRRIIAGSSDRNAAGQVSGIGNILKHPTWNEGLNYDGDIALLNLITPLQYTNVVQQGRILGQGAFVPDNMAATQIGWGATFNEDFPTLFPSRLQKVNVLTVNNARCSQNYDSLLVSPPVTHNMICAAVAQGESGTCIGDRGGPLFVTDVVVGIVSWRLGCTNSTLPTVHTAVSSYTNWIIDNAI